MTDIGTPITTDLSTFAPRNFSCKECSQPYKRHLRKDFVVFGCSNCGALHFRHSFDFKLRKQKVDQLQKASMALGTQIKYNSKTYTVIGYARKREQNLSSANWREYVLADEQGGAAYLNESSGHWLFLEECEKPEGFVNNSPSLTIDGEDYDLVLKYYYETVSAYGEFPYDPINVKSTYVREYASAPFIFSAERNKETYTFFKGRYISKRKLESAIVGSAFNLPDKEGRSYFQPLLFGLKPFYYHRLNILTAIFTLVLFLVFSPPANNIAVTNVKCNLSDTGAFLSQVSPTFYLDAQKTLLRFDSYAPLTNNWAECEISLIDEKTGDEKTIYTGVEYYSGYDSDGTWSEGRTNTSDYLGAIDPGRYHLNVRWSRGNNNNANYSLLVYEDSSMAWNYLIFLLILTSGSILVSIYSYYTTNSEE